MGSELGTGQTYALLSAVYLHTSPSGLVAPQCRPIHSRWAPSQSSGFQDARAGEPSVAVAMAQSVHSAVGGSGWLSAEFHPERMSLLSRGEKSGLGSHAQLCRHLHNAHLSIGCAFALLRVVASIRFLAAPNGYRFCR